MKQHEQPYYLLAYKNNEYIVFRIRNDKLHCIKHKLDLSSLWLATKEIDNLWFIFNKDYAFIPKTHSEYQEQEEKFWNYVYNIHWDKNQIENKMKHQGFTIKIVRWHNVQQYLLHHVYKNDFIDML